MADRPRNAETLNSRLPGAAGRADAGRRNMARWRRGRTEIRFQNKKPPSKLDGLVLTSQRSE
jgi:hypothetical protein